MMKEVRMKIEAEQAAAQQIKDEEDRKRIQE